MTEKERIANYESRIREYTNFAVRGIKKICKECGPRAPGSEAEHKAQQMMAKELEDCCGNVAFEEFKVAPKAFLSWIRLGVLAGIVSIAAYNLGYAAVSAVVLCAELALIVLEFLLYKPVADPFCRKKTSRNLVAARAPAGEVKRRLILCAHVDSSPEWRFTYLGHKWFKCTKLSVAVVAMSAFFLVYGIVISLISLLRSHGWDGVRALGARGPMLNVLGYVFAGLCLPLLAGWFFKNEKRYVEGANDNLSGCFTAMAVPKFLQGADAELENTELVVLCTGSGEAGLRGAKAFFKAHSGAFDDMETVFIAVDTVTDFKYMGVFITDMTNIVQHDPAVCAMMRTAANAAGYELPYENLFFGASDAAAATQAGMRAAAFGAMDPAPAPYYHTRLDTAARLEPKTIEAALEILLEVCRQYDATGLAPFEDSKVAKVKH